MPNKAMNAFFEKMNDDWLKLTYDDVRLGTGYSEVLPQDVDLATRFSRRVALKTPIVSSPMDTVTGAEMAIAMAEAGGLGIIHRGFSPEMQAKAVARVKHRLHGLIETPITVQEDDTVEQVLRMRDEKRFAFHTFPVLNRSGMMIGLVTRNDFDFCTDHSQPVHYIMTPVSELTKGPPGMTVPQAHELMFKRKKKVLPLLTEDSMLRGMYILSDLKRILSPRHKHNLDSHGQLIVGAAVGVGQGALERATLLAAKRCDVFHIDTAHGDSKNVLDTIRELKAAYPDIDVVAGNVSNGKSAKRLVEAGADGVLVGQGPGSICTTRVVAGIGVPQVSAVFDCVRALEGTDVPICADGGINNSGDIVIALAIGAANVMVGRLLAGTEEAPGETLLYQGMQVKSYRGMGSLGAMRDNASSRERYGQAGAPSTKIVPEGVEGVVPYKGTVQSVLEQYEGGIRSGMGSNGARTIQELAEKAEISRFSSAGLTESHPHDIMITAEAPNYHGRG